MERVISLAQDSEAGRVPGAGEAAWYALSRKEFRMRSIGILLALASIGVAQVPPSQQNAPILRGVVLECDQRPAGELSIRASDNQVLRYQFDRRTYAERDDHMIEPSRLQPGE